MDEILIQLIATLGKEKVLIGDELLERYHHIWQMDQPLQAKALLLPASTRDVSIALKICNDFHQPIVVHGGLTNLVGGTETNLEQIALSLEKLNYIEELDTESRTMTVGAGVILETVLNHAQENDLLFPLNFGAKGSAQIGGVISTNAGGLRVLKFGMTRNLILGLEVVLADGTILSNLKKIIKDNSGYDLKQLFVGSEGTLGVITKAVLKLTEAPKSRNSAWVGINGFKNVVRFLKHIDAGLSGGLSGYELIWKDTFIAMTSPPSLVKSPLKYDFEYYVLVESLGSDQNKDRETLEQILQSALESEIISDAAIAYSDADLDWFWKIREDVHVLASQANHDQHFDISLSVSLIGENIEKIISNLIAIPEVEKAFCFGHVADGNIHLIVGKENGSQELTNKVNQVVYSNIEKLNGSVSAEHGIGLHKKAYLNSSQSKEEIELMKVLKKAMDPKGILNPGRIFDLS